MTPNKLEKRLRRAMTRTQNNLEPIEKFFERASSIQNQYRREQLMKLYGK